MRSTALVLATSLLLGCAGATPERTLYLLRTEPVDASGRVEAPLSVGLDLVTVAPYLDQDGIIVETDVGQVQAAREHRWAEPLDAGLRSLLRAGISRALGYEVSANVADRSTWAYTVDVNVDRMHGTMLGTAVLDATYRITPSPGAGEAASYRYARAATLTRKGYPGLVEAQQRLALDLATAIVESLRSLAGT
jgi:uncharacterized lipoprotein YmbA